MSEGGWFADRLVPSFGIAPPGLARAREGSEPGNAANSPDRSEQRLAQRGASEAERPNVIAAEFGDRCR